MSVDRLSFLISGESRYSQSVVRRAVRGRTVVHDQPKLIQFFEKFRDPPAQWFREFMSPFAIFFTALIVARPARLCSFQG
jgi:hypothetical protein